MESPSPASSSTHGEPAKLGSGKFDPNDPAYRRWLWVQYYSKRRSRMSYHIFWRRIWQLLAILTVSGWLLATSAAWAWVKYQRRLEHTRYVNMVFPWRWSRYRAGLSADYLARGEADLAARNPNAAFVDLSTALALSPHDLGIRQRVGRGEFQLGLGSAAALTFKEGAPAAYRAGNASYLKDAFAAAFAAGAPEMAAEIGNGILPARPSGDLISRSVAFQTAVAEAGLKHYADAIRLVRTWELGRSPEGTALWAQCAWDSGKTSEAEDVLQEGLVRFPLNDGLYQLQESWARSRQDFVLARRYAMLRVSANPQLPAARLDELYAQKDVALNAEFERELEGYLRDFAGNLDGLERLAALAVDLGRPELVIRIRELARPATTPQAALFFGLHLVEANLIARHYEAARRELAALDQDRRPVNRMAEEVKAGLEAVAKFGSNAEGANSSFAGFLQQASRLWPEDGLFLIRALRATGRRGEALKLQEVLAQAYPRRADIKAERVGDESSD